MNISTMVYGIVALVVCVIIVANVLLPTIDGLNIDNTTYAALFSVVGVLGIIIPVMAAVRMIGRD